MARYLCSSCQEVVESAAMRVAFCASCGTPVTTEDMLLVDPATAGGAAQGRNRMMSSSESSGRSKRALTA
jgi:predicted amidophosphoribosyltransferase